MQPNLKLLVLTAIDDLEILFREHHAVLTRTAYYILKDQEVSRDLVQDLFIKLWSDKDKLRDVRNLKGYLFTSIRNLSLNHLEKVSREKQRSGYFLELVFLDGYDPFNDSTDGLAKLEIEISKAVSQLPTQCRLIFTLNRFEGLTTEEIAQYFNLSKRTVETQVSKALKILRQKVQSPR